VDKIKEKKFAGDQSSRKTRAETVHLICLERSDNDLLYELARTSKRRLLTKNTKFPGTRSFYQVYESLSNNSQKTQVQSPKTAISQKATLNRVDQKRNKIFSLGKNDFIFLNGKNNESEFFDHKESREITLDPLGSF
jgi:hypothetical protein